MPETTNLAHRIEERLPEELVAFIQHAGRLAAAKGDSLYLVGGVVRDLLLGKSSLDIDLVIEGDAIALAQQLIGKETGKITIHKRFNTAKITWHGWSIDITSARSESYAQPGALPDVKPGSLSDDLLRRDFSINAMAIGLNPRSYGRLIDPYSGQRDIRNRLIRILHPTSFIDDSTRIWRGLRYEQRLGFRLEADTLRLLRRDINMLDSISGDRIRYELECILGEELPERVFKRAAELGVLAKLSPSLKGNGWLEEKFKQARQMYLPDKPPPGIYMALLSYNLADEERERFISYLRLPKAMEQTLRDSSSTRAKLKKLADAGISPSAIHHLLTDSSIQAIAANLIASDSPTARRNLKLYLDKLRYVKTALTGNDLIKMGIPPGPHIKEILNRLLDARLDGSVRTREEEEEMARGSITN